MGVYDSDVSVTEDESDQLEPPITKSRPNYQAGSPTAVVEGILASEDSQKITENLNLNIEILTESKAEPTVNITEGELKTSNQSRERYFNNVSTVRCFNCGKSGHRSDECPQDALAKPCNICLSKLHESFSCPNSICMRCNRKGHSMATCEYSLAFQHRYVLDDLFSLTISSHRNSANKEHDISIPKGILKERRFEDVLCAACGEFGHVKCGTVGEPSLEAWKANPNAKESLALPLLYILPWEFSKDGEPINPLRRQVASTIKALITCTNCGEPGHVYASCRKAKVETLVHNFRPRMFDCFSCHEEGHHRDICPNINNHNRAQRPSSAATIAGSKNLHWKRDRDGDSKSYSSGQDTYRNNNFDHNTKKRRSSPERGGLSQANNVHEREQIYRPENNRKHYQLGRENDIHQGYKSSYFAEAPGQRELRPPINSKPQRMEYLMPVQIQQPQMQMPPQQPQMQMPPQQPINIRPGPTHGGYQPQQMQNFIAPNWSNSEMNMNQPQRSQYEVQIPGYSPQQQGEYYHPYGGHLYNHFEQRPISQPTPVPQHVLFQPQAQMQPYPQQNFRNDLGRNSNRGFKGADGLNHNEGNKRGGRSNRGFSGRNRHGQ